MAHNFQTGDLCDFDIQAAGGNRRTLGIRSHSLRLTNILHDVSVTTHNGHTGRIAGKKDGSGTVNAVFDADELPWASPPDVRPGVAFIGYFGLTTAGVGIALGMRIENVNYEQAVDTEIRYSFDASYDVDTLTITYGEAGIGAFAA